MITCRQCKGIINKGDKHLVTDFGRRNAHFDSEECAKVWSEKSAMCKYKGHKYAEAEARGYSNQFVKMLKPYEVKRK